jgi:hypothetical protein
MEKILPYFNMLYNWLINLIAGTIWPLFPKRLEPVKVLSPTHLKDHSLNKNEPYLPGIFD